MMTSDSTTQFLKFYYAVLAYRQSSSGVKRALWSAVKAVSNEYCQRVIPIILWCTRGKHRLDPMPCEGGEPRLIVSLTSFPARINSIWLVIETLMRQTVKPDSIVLYLYNQQFDTVESLPKKLRKMMPRGLQVRFVDEDIRSHTKYSYAMEEFPNDFLVTVDDDLFYPNNIIEQLTTTYKQYDGCVVANRIHTLTFDGQENLCAYNRWDDGTDNDSYNHLQTGVGGVLYPPYRHADAGVYYKDILNRELAMQMTPAGDDLWLFAMVRLAGNRVVKAQQLAEVAPCGIHIHNNVKLYSVNCGKNYNDEQIENLRRYYKEHIGIDPFDDKPGMA